FVNQTGDPSTMGHVVSGTSKRLFGYTIQPIDAAIGVVVHEFGHDLGLPDEYDTNTNRGAGKGSPVGHWSVMSNGSWAGSLPGSQPTGFSAYARSYLQARHGANWINEVTVNLADLTNSQDINLVEAVNHTANTINQVRIDIPSPRIDFKSPFAGNYQYYSGEGHDLNNTMSFQINVPNSDNVSLTMKAHWDIEEDWDFARVLFNDTAIPGNHTRATNPYTGQYALYDDVTHYITDKSQNIAGAQGPDYWVDLTYDISQFKGQTVTVKFEYKSDSNTGGYGLTVDEIKVLDGTSEIYTDGAESDGVATLAGYSRITSQRDGLPQNYWVQLRSHNGPDNGLSTRSYDHGVVIWFADSKFADNNSSDHPGEGFVGVVDADQVLIGTSDTGVQVRDAAFSMFSQTPYSGDTNLAAKTLFSDADDYSAPTQAESGIKLPVHGLNIEVVNQAADSSTATIRVSRLVVINAAFSYIYAGTNVTFTNSSTSSGNISYDWDFGDGSVNSTEASPTHNYTSEGEYTVTLTITDNDTSDSDSVSQTVRVGALPEANFTSSVNAKTVTFSNSTSGGIGGLSYSWNFGDGNSSTEETPTHTYNADGSYTVQLTVTDSTGASDSFSRQVTIQTVIQPPASGGSSGGGSIFWTLLLLPLIRLRKKD
ncbi:MAG: immune inhibitor A, partial [Kangiellaceae bacterium]|nr:immune inhibitor A [Kangiellaceae bacterium]